MTGQQKTSSGGGFTRAVTKKALGPIVASAATAGTAYLLRKGSEVWQQTLEPKIQEKGGGRAVASEALDGLRERLPSSALEKLEALTSGAAGSEGGTTKSAERAESPSDGDRAEERQKREQRRRQRRRALEQAGSS